MSKLGKKIYVAGPMTGIEDYNYPLFNEVAARLRGMGYVVFSPTEVGGSSSLDEEVKSWEYYMREGLKFLLECDSVCLLPGWEKSKGACLEYKIASALGMDIRTVDEWFDGDK